MKFTREQVKAQLRAKGWSYRDAAQALCPPRAYQHISYVLNGHRASRRLLRELAALPARRVAG